MTTKRKKDMTKDTKATKATKDTLRAMKWQLGLTRQQRQRVVGVDVSLNGTGIATAERTLKVKHPSNVTGLARNADVCSAITGHAVGSVLVVIEEPPAHVRNSTLITFGLHGQVLLDLYRARRRFVEVNPKTLKKWATGSGNADADDMIHFAELHSGIRFASDDEADAYWLRQIGLHLTGAIMTTVDARNVTGVCDYESDDHLAYREANCQSWRRETRLK